MLAIRMQRTGRKGHSQFRVIIQDSRAHPKSGRVVQYLGSYDPHVKKAQLNTEAINTYLNNGAQPSDRVAKLLKKEGVKLPTWVQIAPDKKRPIKNTSKLRRNAPPGEKPAPEELPAAAEPTAEETVAAEQPDTTEKEVSQADSQVEEAEPATEPMPAEPPAEVAESPPALEQQPTEPAAEPEPPKSA